MDGITPVATATRLVFDFLNPASPLLRAMLLARLLFSVIPVSGKKPTVTWAEYQQRRATPDEITSWFLDADPGTGIGIVTGAISGIVVVDADSPDAVKWCEEHLPYTPLQVATAKGRHYYYRHPEGVIKNGTRLRDGVDVRGDGGYVVAPGSPHPGGGRYVGLNPELWTADTVAGLPVYDPGWFGADKPPGLHPPTNARRPAKGLSDKEKARQAQAYIERIPGATEGERNTVAYEVACRVACDYALGGTEEGYALVRAWDQTCDPPLEVTDPGELRRVWDSACSTAQGEPGSKLRPPGRKGGKSQATRLLALALGLPGLELSYDQEGVAWLSWRDTTRGRQTVELPSGQARDLLVGLHYRRYHSACGREPQQQALDTLAARARLEGLQRPVATRWAEGDDGSIYWDLCDGQGSVVRIDATGWTVSVDPRVRYRRPRQMRALPTPAAQGSWEPLRQLLGLPALAWILVIGWLLGAAWPTGPYPILILEGPPGAGKSLLAWCLRMLLDPGSPELLRPPKSEEDLATACRCRHALVLDNIDRLQPWQSDTLCAVATGGGWTARQHYAQGEEHSMAYCRPVILTGVDSIAHRPDLQDRSMLVRLEPRAHLRPEQTIREDLRTMLPVVMAAICEALSASMRPRLAFVPGGIRMIDAARRVILAEQAGALPWSPGDYLRALHGAQAEQSSASVIGDVWLVRILRLLACHGGAWSGTATDLLHATSQTATQEERRDRLWPQTAASAGRRLAYATPILAQVGVTVSRQHGHGPRTVTVACPDLEGLQAMLPMVHRGIIGRRR